MTNLLKKVCYLFAVILFAIIAITFVLNSNIAYAQELSIVKETKTVILEKDIVSFEEESTYNTVTNIFDIPIKINSKSTIVDLNIKQNNIKINNYEIVSNCEFIIQVEVIKYKSDFKASIYLDSGETIEFECYFIVTEQGVFYSRESYYAACEVYYKYAKNYCLIKDSNIPSIESILKSVNEYAEKDIFVNKRAKANMLKSSGSTDTEAHGTIRWPDDNNRNQYLKWVKVELYDDNTIGGDTLLGTAYTNNKGNFVINFKNNDTFFDHGGSDIYIVVYAGDNNTRVVDNSLNAYTICPDADHNDHQNVVTGSKIDLGFDISTDGEFKKYAQISQALLCGKYFAWEMMGTEPSELHLIYPYIKQDPNETWCYVDGGEIRAPQSNSNAGCPNDYASWDTIMHEYGHHIEYCLGWNAWGANHSGSPSLIQQLINSGVTENVKEIGIRVSWTESWATIFGMVAQSYYYVSTSIPTVSDSLYSDFEFVFNIENSFDPINNETKDIRFGEACEDAICAILWDIFDSSNELNDNFSLSHTNWWNVTTQNSPNSFSDFIQNFYNRYPDKIDGIAPLLEYYKIGASDITDNNTTQITGNLPCFQWDNVSGWDNHPYNKFEIRFSSENSESLIINNIYTNIYTLTESQWNTILNWTGNTLYLTIVSYHTYTPTTGGYYSKQRSYSLPIFKSRVKSDNKIEIMGVRNTSNSSLIVPTQIGGKSVTSIGDGAFSNLNISTIIIPSTINVIGNNAFSGCNNLTIYATQYLLEYTNSANPLQRPVLFCNLSSDSSFVYSFVKSTLTLLYPNNTINNPTRSGYSFAGWYTSSSYSGTSYDNIASAPNETLYAKWNSNSSSSCITTGSLITLADGTQTQVENLTGNEQLLVWDMLNGTFTSAPILFIDTDPTTTYEVITLAFSDGTTVNVIDEHAFFDTTLNKYVFLRSDASQYIGHYFTKQILDGNNNMIQTTVQLVDVSIEEQITTAYSPVTYGHLCYYVNGMLSMPGNTESFINIFDVNPTTMAYDETAMAQDIATYGLYTYEEFSNIIPIPQLVFDAFNGQYLKVAIGKGITTLEEIQALLDRYSVFFE